MNSPPPLNIPEPWQMNTALLLVRIASALAFLYHGSSILFGAFEGPGPEKFAVAHNMPVVMGYLVGLAQVAGGLAVLTGVLTRVGAACVAVVMLGAIFQVHLPHGFDVGKGGMEYALTQLLVAIALIFTGPGCIFALVAASSAIAKGLKSISPIILTMVTRCIAHAILLLQSLAYNSMCSTRNLQKSSAPSEETRMPPHGNWPLLAALLLLASAVVVLGGASNDSVPQVRYPQPDIGVDTLALRKQAQFDTVNQFKVFYQFHLTDQVKESGITFIHHMVDDAGVDYKPVHYDHGTGIAVADVDGDGFYDIYFVNQVGGNELWKNLGRGKFKNITKEAGVDLPGRISVTASFADIDNDGTQDLFVTTVLGGNALFKNDGHGHFTNITKAAGLDLVSHSSGAVFFDYDNDGLLDLLVCNVGKYTSDKKGAQGQYVGLPDAFSGHLHPQRFEYPVLYKNLGHDRFKDVTAEVGLRPTGWCGDATFADLNGNGFPGLFILNMQGHDHYLENVGGKKFVDKTEQYFSKTPWGAMGVKFFDYDNDGRMDLIVTDMHSDMSETVDPDREKLKSTMRWPDSFLQGSHSDYIWGNAFYHHLGNGKFEEASDHLGVENYWPWGVSVGDLNADGWDDIFISSGMSFPFRYGINSMLLNNRGEKFLDSEFLLGIEPRKDIYVPWFDLDCSQNGLDELNQKVCGGRSGRIAVMSPRSSRSSVMFDLDNDGDLDIVTNDFNSAPQVLISDLAQQKAINWLKVVLVGTRSNRNGLGATVRVQAAGQTYTKYNDGKSGYLSQSVLPLYFGLGDTTKIDRVEVDWPSGQKQVVTNGLAENQVLRITESK